jgi:hypothetical protein
MNTIKVGSLVVLTGKCEASCVDCPGKDICTVLEYGNGSYQHRIVIASTTTPSRKCWFSKASAKEMILEIDSSVAKELFT